MKFIGYAVSFLAVIFFSSMFSGYALSVLWGWFIVPTFDIVQITIPVAIGIALIVSFLTHQSDNSSEQGKGMADVLAKGFFMSIFKPSFALLIGWIITLFM